MRFLLPVVLLLPAPAAKAASATAGAVILRHDQSARSAALGGGFCADDAGVDSFGGNPAGVAGAVRPELLSTFTSGVADDAFGFLGYAHPLKAGVVSAGLTYYDAGTVDVVSTDGASRAVSAERDYAGSAGWAMPLLGGVTAGAGAKYYKFTLGQAASASGFAADFGAQWETPAPGLRVGAAVQNVGRAARYESASDPLPLTGRAGAYWAGKFALGNENSLTAGRAALGVDAVRVLGERVAPVVGGEFAVAFGPSTEVALRSSYTFNRAADGLAFGVGVREGRFTADYALVSKRDLGNVQDVSLRVRF